MQAQAYRSARQLPWAANKGHNVHSGMPVASRRQLHIAANYNKSLLMKPSPGLNSRGSVMLWLNRSNYKIAGNIAHFKDNVRCFSSKKNKYCLKRLVNRKKASGFDSVKDVMSGANEAVQQRATVYHAKMLQAVFAMNGESAPISGKMVGSRTHVALASFTGGNQDETKLAEEKTVVSKSAESYTADIQVTSDNSVLPLSGVAGPDVNGTRLRAWHRISGAVRRIPSPNWGKINLNVIPLVSRVQEDSNSKSTEIDDDGKSSSETISHEQDAGLPREKVTLDSDKHHSVVHTNSAGGFDCDTTVSEIKVSPPKYGVTGSTLQANTTIAAEELSHQDSNFYQRMTALRGKLPPLSVPSSVSDRLPNLSETTSKVRQRVSSVNLPKWKQSEKVSSPDGKGDFDLDSPHLMVDTHHHIHKEKGSKEEYKSDAIIVAEQLLEHTEPIEVKKTTPAKKTKTVLKPVVSKASIDSRTKTLATGIKMSESNSSCLIKLERLCNHLVQYPESTQIATQEKLIPCLLQLRIQAAKDKDFTEHIHKTLALLGHADPVKGQGLRVLSLDGGGCRGIVAIEALREIERRTKQDIRDMFDYMVGVSSGAVLAYLLAFLNASLDQCEELFRELGYEVFERNSIVGTSKLLLNHAYYDTDGWIKILKQHAKGETPLIDTARDPKAPKVSAIANKINVSSIKNFMFRNYHLPAGVQSQYQGSVRYRCWEALRASSAAPGYFEEFKLDENVFQDGGVLTNNPSAVGLHECRLLWPNTPIQCVVSLGTGRYDPTDIEYGTEYSSLKKKLVKIMQSATETESVHTILQDLLPPGTYFRFNPTISEDFALDESRPDKLNQMQTEAQDYLSYNQKKLDQVSEQLCLPKTPFQTAQDWVKLQKLLYT
ncbi:uncharacterized protein [Amphiura filiformis]|uniref:uncharacterized protein n=1 Tax=Amphiura filiformis TaxID=82378 RepID=UPI003B20FDC3